MYWIRQNKNETYENTHIKFTGTIREDKLKEEDFLFKKNEYKNNIKR
ncbi:MAG: hypothetical protein ACRDD2_00240 [Sarcina sp.]